MTPEETLTLTDGDRVIVRWRDNDIPGTVLGEPCDLTADGIGIELGVVLDAGLGDRGEGEPIDVYDEDIVRRAEDHEGLVCIGGAYYAVADTIFADVNWSHR